ncbi:Thioredoxin, putative [Leishmania donovani]|uniref:Thioredoxin, putative n=3 Tax=Leishmania donovani TaxID=5661 RepID=A0A3S7X2I2_LEIDO|nr:Thioredoxin, putative [Leishmania donovani]
MYTGAFSMFAAWAAVGAHRGNWRTRVANSWVAAPSNDLRTPSSVCLISYPQAERTTSTDIGRRGGAVLGATAPDIEGPRYRQRSLSVQRLLSPTEAPSPLRVKTTLTEQRMTAVASSVAATAAAASLATRMRVCAALDAAAKSDETPADTGSAPSFDCASQHTKDGAPAAASPDDSAAFTEMAGQKQSSPAADHTCDSPPLPPSGTEPLAATPPAPVFSFHGNPQELQDRLRGAKALVFFYKASCAPCAVIRSKLLHAVAGAGGGGSGATAAPPTSAEHATEAAGVDGLPSPLLDYLQQNQREPDSPTGVSAAAPIAAYAEAKDAKAAGATTASLPATTMTLEDQKSCDVACRFLGDATKSFAHSVILITVDTNANAEVTALHDIRSLPTFMAYRNGCIVGRFEGSQEDEINKLVDLLAENSTERSPTTDNRTPSPLPQQEGATSKRVSGD